MIIANGRTELWVLFLKEAQGNAKTSLSETVESYLVFALERFLRRIDFGATPFAFKRIACLESSGTKQQSLLAETADESMLMAGLFPERAKRFNTSVSYFINISEICFAELAVLSLHARHKGEAELYNELGHEVKTVARTLYAARKTDAINLLRPENAIVH